MRQSTAQVTNVKSSRAPSTAIVTAKGVVIEIAQPNKVVFNRTNDSVDWASFTWNPVTGCEHGCRFCLDPETPILKLDMTWCPIGELVIGDSLLGFDEHGRKVLRESIVEDKWNVATEDAYEIVAGGRTVVCSGNHKWLTSGGKWVETRRLTLGHKIVDTGYSIGKNRSLSYSAGYVAGCLGGDGTFRFPGDESDSGQVWARVAATDIEVLPPPVSRIVHQVSNGHTCENSSVAEANCGCVSVDRNQDGLLTLSVGTTQRNGLANHFSQQIQMLLIFDVEIYLFLFTTSLERHS